MVETIESILQKYPVGKKESLIPLLQEIQQEEGQLSDFTLNKVSRHMNIPLNKIYGVATFYDQFRFEKRGQYHIQICKGTACHLFNSSTFQSEIEKILQVKAGQTTKDGKYSLEIVNCLGACSNSPIISLNGVPYGNLSIERLQKILSKIKGNNVY
ncbi:MAG: NAD(P)H-dependent oxidoreductase subunit E [Bacteroidales bacterium]|jgi:NADH-quinone oxidoreductase subunit E